MPVEGAAGVGYCLRRGYQIPPLMFDEQELQALSLYLDIERVRFGERLQLELDVSERAGHGFTSGVSSSNRLGWRCSDLRFIMGYLRL